MIPSEENWALEGDEFDPFIGRQHYFDPDPKYKVTIDKKNAYIKILYETNGLESCFTMCYFIKADKTHWRNEVRGWNWLRRTAILGNQIAFGFCLRAAGVEWGMRRTRPSRNAVSHPQQAV